MPDFQELKIKIVAEDNATAKVKEIVKDIKKSISTITNLDFSSLQKNLEKSLDSKSIDRIAKDISEKLKSAFDLNDIISNLKKDLKEVSNELNDTKISVINKNNSSTAKSKANYSTQVNNDLGYLMQRKIGKPKTLNEPIVIETDGTQDIVENVRTIVEYYQKIENGIKVITRVEKSINEDTNKVFNVEVKDVTELYDKITKVSNQLPDFVNDGSFEKVKTKVKELGNELQTIEEKFQKIEGTTKTTLTVVNGKIQETVKEAVKAKEEVKMPNFDRKDLQAKTSKTKYLEDGEVEKTETYEEILNGIKTKWTVINGKIRDVTKTTVDLEKKTKKSQGVVSHLLQNIKKIILYRLIRKAMADVAKALKEAVTNLALFDSTFNDTMSKIVTSSEKIKASIALLFQPIIDSVEPLITSLSGIFENFANSISKAYASSRGLTTYTKLNAKYTKDYADSLNEANKTLSFDKFESLKAAQDSIYETASINDEVKESPVVEAITSLKPVIDNLINIVTRIINTLGPILGAIINVATEVINSLMPIVEIVLDSILSLLETINFDNIAKVLITLVDVVADILEILFDVLPLKEVLMTIGDLLNFVFILLKPVLANLKMSVEMTKMMYNTIFKPIYDLFDKFYGLTHKFYELINKFFDNIFTKTIDASGNLMRKIFGFANGGVVASGNIIRTNEFGTPEWIGKMGSNTAVVNDTQMSDVMYNAVYSAIRDGIGNNGNNITIDFSGLNNNVIARELAKPIANQFARQNIKVSGA